MWRRKSAAPALVGWLPYGDARSVASARLRCFTPLRVLRSQGFPVEVYRPENQGQYRVIVLQKQYSPLHLALATQVQKGGAQVVFDICDNHLYNPHRLPRYAKQAANLRRMLCAADKVTISTPTLGEVLGVDDFTVIDDCIEEVAPFAQASGQLMGKGQRLVSYVSGSRLDILWFGVWGSERAPFGMCSLTRLAEPLRACAAQGEARLTVVSNCRASFDKWVTPLALPTRYITWQGHRHLSRLLHCHDLCVLPVTHNPYTACKSPNRLVTALYSGIPVVADMIPAYRELAPYAVFDNWDEGLLKFREQRLERHRQTDQGQAYVGTRYSASRIAAQWRTLFERLL